MSKSTEVQLATVVTLAACWYLGMPVYQLVGLVMVLTVLVVLIDMLAAINRRIDKLQLDVEIRRDNDERLPFD